MTVNVEWLFLEVLCVGLQCVIVVFPGYTHLLFATLKAFHFYNLIIVITVKSLSFLYLDFYVVGDDV